MFEANGNILCQYHNVDSGDGRANDGSATVGIRDTDGQLHGSNSQWSFNQAVITNGEASLFSSASRPARPIVLAGLTVLGNGSFQFGFCNLTGGSFTVLGTTNVASPLNEWLNLGPALETLPASGQFQFIDPQTTNNAQRFYSVRSP